MDGASNWPLFAEKAKQLLEEDKVAVTFGCWTSVSRKSVLPVFEKDNGLLFYPVQYEGEELSKNIFYTAEAVNQQAIPAVDYLLAQGKKKFYLIGTDYVYPQTTNLILYKYLLLHGIPPEDIGGGLRKDDSGKVISAGKYVPFGHTDFQQIVADIKQFAAVRRRLRDQHHQRRLQCSFLQGNRRRWLDARGLSGGFLQSGGRRTPQLCRPRTWWVNSAAGLISCRSKRRKTRPSSKIGTIGSQPKATPASSRKNAPWTARWFFPMTAFICGKRPWKRPARLTWMPCASVLESGDISFEGPGGKITMQANHHCTKNVYIGETKANGQFKILETFSQVVGEPFVADTFQVKN